MDILKRIALLFLLIFLCNCQITYYSKSAYQQMWILTHRKPIEKVLQENDLKSEEAKKLKLTIQARNFAKETLKLKVGDSYSTFVRLKKPYVVWAVNASEKWKLEHYTWNYPIVGKLPYKGFPEEADAIEETRSFDNKKYDTYIRGVTAYSTLGWFADPLLSTMLHYNDHDLVNTIIHESTHATIFIKGNADFNERLASFIGNKGTELFYTQIEGIDSASLKQIKNENDDELLFSKFISDEIKQLEEFYNKHSSQNEIERQQQFDKIKFHFQSNLKSRLKTNQFKNFENTSLNNARLLLFKTYVEDLSDFEKLYKLCEKNFDLFLVKIKTIENSIDPSTDLKKMIENYEKNNSINPAPSN